MATQFINQKGISNFIKRLIMLITAVIVGTVPLVADGGDILLGTGAEGGFSHFTGRAICRILNRSTGELNCRAIPAPGDIHNLTNLNGGSLDLALLDSSLLHDALTRKDQFKFLDIRYDNLGALLPLYQLPILLIARVDAGIGALSDLKGKRINVGTARSTVREAVDFIMTAKGWTKKDFKLVQELPATLSQDTMAFCHGSIEAMVHIGVHPDSALQQLRDLCAAVPVDMDDPDIARLVGQEPGYLPVRIPSGTYPGFEKPIASFGTTIQLVASGSLDDETTIAIITALEKHQANLKSIHPALAQFSVKPANDPDIGLSLHPGAAAYFSAQGK